MNNARLRSLPPVNAMIDGPDSALMIASYGRDEFVRAVRDALDATRAEIKAGIDVPTDYASLLERSRTCAESGLRQLRPVINATGILLNTGLGRAPIAAEAARDVQRIIEGYSNLEFNLETGERGDRTSGVETLLRRITGAEAAIVVNNNAAATVLALKALAAGREVIVSRGQLVEIGGSFRLPEIFEVSGAMLREVGTTNRTRLADYAHAISASTSALLRVHPSNYRVVGFTEAVEIGPMVELAHRHGLWAIDDVGSGLLRPGFLPDVIDEPTVADSIASGADVVLFSGDKLLGGPQCGILVGNREAVARMKSDPLMRALRVDKMTLAALESTLRLTLRDSSKIPLRAFLCVPIEELRSRADRMAERLTELGFTVSVELTDAMLGGGSVPTRPIPSLAVRITLPFPGPIAGRNEADLARILRLGHPAVVTRVRGEAVWIDLKAVFPAEDETIRSVFAGLVEPTSD